MNREVLRALRGWDPFVFHKPPPKNHNHHHYMSETSPPSHKPQHNHHDLRPNEHERVILLSGPPGVGKTTMAHILAKHAGYRSLEINGSDERSATILRDRVLNAMESTTLSTTIHSNRHRTTTNNNDSSNNHHNVIMSRPNCIILDEIDGADAKGAIAALVDIIRAELPSSSKNHTHINDGNNNKRKQATNHRSKKPYLRRPIIFICNHKYAPALRPLLPYCRHFDVTPPSTQRLVTRLSAILAAERVAVASSSNSSISSAGSGGGSRHLLHQLVVATGGDIRSCLHVLQFASVQARPMPSLTATSPQASSIKTSTSVVNIAPCLTGGQGNHLKDERLDISNIITCIFRKWKTHESYRQSERFHDEKWKSNVSSKSAVVERSIDRIMDLVQSFDDRTKTLDSLFLNLLRVSYIDPTMDRCAAAHDWISGADWCHNHHNGSDVWNTPSCAAAIHLLCRVEMRPDLTFSTRELGDVFFKREDNRGLLQRFFEGCCGSVVGLHKSHHRTMIHMDRLAMETIPFGLWMLSAGQGSCSLNRPVSTIERLSAGELQAFQSHVQTLLALGLRYVAVADQENEDNGLLGTKPKHSSVSKMSSYSKKSIQLCLDPPIDTLVHYTDLILSPGHERQPIPAPMKELLAQYTIQEAVRERSAGSSGDNDSPTVALQADMDEQQESVIDTQPPPLLVSSATQSTKALMSTKALSESTKKKTDDTSSKLEPAPKRIKTMNFLSEGAAKVKAARTAKRVALFMSGVHHTNSTKHEQNIESAENSVRSSSRSSNGKTMKLSHTGSGVPIQNVIRYKFQKGFTQAVRTPCRWEDLMG